MKESSFWSTRLRPQLVKACRMTGVPHHFERVENAVAAGTPDVDYCIAGVSGKLELKYTDKHPVRPTTPVLGKDNGLRRSQVIWIVRRVRAGGYVFVVIGTPVNTWVINARGLTPRELVALELRTASQLREISAWCACTHEWRTLPLILWRL